MRKLLIVALAAGLAACSGGKEAAKQSASRPQAKPSPVVQSGPSAYKVGRPYKIAGRRYVPEEKFVHVETGQASWYGPGFHGRKTANGEIFDQRALTAAHRTLQLPSIVRVVNVGNGRSVVVRVNDRGPYHGNRIIDLSEAAAEALGFKHLGVALVRVEVLERASRDVKRLARSGVQIAELEAVRARAAGGETRRPERDVDLAQIGRETGEAANDRAAAPARPPPPAPPRKRDRTVLVASAAELEPQGTAPAPVAFVQAGAFYDAANALRLQARVQSVGDAAVVPTQVQGRTLYRVRLGPYADRAAAERAMDQTAALGVSGARLVLVR